MREIRDRHEHKKVVGSPNRVQTQLREKLFDRLDLLVYPVVLGVGKKVFDDGAVPTNVTRLEPPVASPNGTVYLRYGLADGTPEPSLYVTGRIDVEVLVFASDGGGVLYALPAAQAGPVYRLRGSGPPGRCGRRTGRPGRRGGPPSVPATTETRRRDLYGYRPPD